MTNKLFRPLFIVFFCVTISCTFCAKSHNTAADLLEISDYFHDIFEETDKNADELKEPFENFLPKDFKDSFSFKTFKHFSQLVTYTKKNFSQSSNRYVLLQKIVRKIATLYPNDSSINNLYELYKLADFTGTNIIVDAIALYFLKNPSHIKKIPRKNGHCAFLKKRVEFMRNAHLQMSIATNDYVDAGILPVITHDIKALHPYAQASTLRDNAQDTLKIFKKNPKLSSRLNYLEQCLQVAPHQILHEKLPAFFKKDIERLLTDALTHTVNQNLDSFLSHYTDKGMRNIALKVCYTFLQQKVTEQETFKKIFEGLNNKTLKYFCRYLYYINNNHQFIDTIHTPRTLDFINRIHNQELDLSGCLEHVNSYLSDILDLVLILAPNLTTLYLNENKLVTLPEQIGNFAKLENLNLNKNQLITLPEQIFNLVNLKKLFLGKNKFTTISPHISKLINLEVLYLTENKFKKVSKQIYNLTSLKELSLADNQLMSLSKKISNLTNLRTLTLDNNKFLTALPIEIGNLINLEEIWLNKDQLTSIICKIEKLVKLNTLVLYKNQFSHKERQKIKNKFSSMFQPIFLK